MVCRFPILSLGILGCKDLSSGAWGLPGAAKCPSQLPRCPLFWDLKVVAAIIIVTITTTLAVASANFPQP